MVFQISNIVFLFPVVVLAYATNAGIGIGAAIVAVTLGSNFIDVFELLPIILPLSVITTGYLAVRERHNIEMNLLFRRIIPNMGLGMGLGIILMPFLDGMNLKAILGVLVILLSVWQLLNLFVVKSSPKPVSSVKSGLFQLLAGIVHAIYTTGGPLLAYSVSRCNLPKKTFRATMCAVLVLLNLLLIVAFSIAHRFNAETLKTTLPLIIALPVGIKAGEWIYNRFSEKTFKLTVYLILIGSGISLLVNSLVV